MTRRTDFAAAEKVSIALLTRGAFGRDAGLRNALLAGLDVDLVTRIFDRDRNHIRKDVQGVHVLPDRRALKRPPEH